MAKRVIRLNESSLRRMIKESVQRVLAEKTDFGYFDNFDYSKYEECYDDPEFVDWLCNEAWPDSSDRYSQEEIIEMFDERKPQTKYSLFKSFLTDKGLSFEDYLKEKEGESFDEDAEDFEY